MMKLEAPFIEFAVQKVQVMSIYAGPLLTLVEFVKIGVFKQTAGVLWIIWVAFATMSIGWMIWGIYKHNTAIVVNNFINFLICVGIVGMLIM
jgi:hypothetical protein